MFFVVSPAEGYEWAFPKRQEDYAAFEKLDGTRQRAAWTPIEMQRSRPDERSEGIASDFPWFVSGLVMRKTALDALGSLLTASGEILPLSTDDGIELWILNSRVVPALDEERSEIWRYPDGRVMWADVPVLRRQETKALDMFRIYPASSLFVSERFVQRVNAAALRGLTFEPVQVSE